MDATILLKVVFLVLFVVFASVLLTYIEAKVKMNITKRQYEALTGKKLPKKKKPKKDKIPKDKPKGIQFIETVLKFKNIEFEAEFKFHKVRRFRFDFAIPKHKIAIEYEGLNSKKSGHTTLKGYTSDCEKYNLATMEGWSILRYTVLNYKEFVNDIETLKELRS